MLVIYRFLINLTFILSPIIIVFRLIKKKEDLKRFKEKLCFFSQKRGSGSLIWFHGASVGEIRSIIPIIEKLEKNKKIKKILITSNTLSSSKIVQKLKLNKVVHQFFPIDTNFLSKIFLNYWKPSAVFFIDSEIWPNMFLNIKKKGIPVGLLNGRITKRTFKRWSKFPNFSKKFFSKFDLCLSSSHESQKYLKSLGAKNVKFFGNLKFTQSNEKEINLKKDFKKFLSSKKVWCASSTHLNEENFCGKIHKELKKKYKNLLTIIIPRHVERVNSIETNLNKLGLKTQTYESSKKIDKNTDIYIVDTYGKTKSFYSNCNNVFLGGSLIEHGGQNPLEAAKYGCNILHGPNVSNFNEIYKFLKKNKMSSKISNQKQALNVLTKLFSKGASSKQIQKKLDVLGKKIFKFSLKEVNLLLKYEI